MELYQFINENQIKKYNGGMVVYGERIYTNPTEQHIRNAGFKDLVIDDEPTYDEATQYIVPYYEDGTSISKHWRVEDIPTDDEVVADDIPTE